MAAKSQTGSKQSNGAKAEETDEYLVRVGGTLQINDEHIRRGLLVRDVVDKPPAGYGCKRFGHRVPFDPSQKKVEVGFLMFKNPKVPLTDVGGVVAEFGLRPMVLHEGLALCNPYSELDIGVVLDWFFKQAGEVGIIPRVSTVAIGQFRLPIMMTMVTAGGTSATMIPCLDMASGGVSWRVSLLSLSPGLVVGQQIFPCVASR